MKALLIYPEMPDTFYAMKHFMRIVGKKAAYPPLGLLTVASMLPADWDKKVVDLNAKTLSDEAIAWADLVFVSAMNVQEQSVRDIIQQCKRLNKKIVAGGPLFTHEYERFDQIDHFVLNEAEITLQPFLDDLANEKPQRIYQSDKFSDITKTPLPSYHLIDFKDYLYAIVQFSRGCPFLCDFCDVTALFGRVARTKTSDQIIGELELIRKDPNIQMVLFADDNLIGNKRVLKYDLLPALIEWRKKVQPEFYFATQLTINLVNDNELMNLMIDAGFRHIFIGIETPDEKSLEASSKGQNLKRDLIENINLIHEKGFIISGGFIVGFDEDRDDIFDRQIQFIQESGIPLPIVNILKAPPGTELYERIKKENRLSKPFAFLEGETNIVPVMDLEKLYRGFLHVTEEIYTPSGSYDRIIQFFKKYKYPKTQISVKTPFNAELFAMVFRIVYLLGIKDESRGKFWKLIFWAFRNDIKLVDKSVFYAIMMYQMKESHKTLKQHVERELQVLGKAV